jgi:hypothetical protein
MLLACGSDHVLIGLIPEAGSEASVGAEPPVEGGDATLQDAGSDAIAATRDATADTTSPDADASPETGSPCSQPVSAASGTAYWAQFLTPRPNSSFLLSGVALDGQGNAVVVGDIHGTVSIQGTTIPGSVDSLGSSPNEVLVAKFDAAGTLVFAEKFTATCPTGCSYVAQWGTSVALDASGNIYVAGGFQERMTIPGSPPKVFDTGSTATNGGAEWAFLAKLDPSGQHIWSQSFGISNAQPSGAAATSVVLDPQGAVVMGGLAGGSIDFAGAGDAGPGWFDLPQGIDQAFVAKFTSDGAPVWSRVLMCSQGGESEVKGVAVDPEGSLYLAGDFQATLRFIGAGVDGGGADAGMQGVCDSGTSVTPTCLQTGFAAKVLSDGTLAWSNVLEGHGQSSSLGVSVDDLGNPVEIGWAFDYLGLDDAGNPISTPGRGVITKLDPASGATQWSTSAGHLLGAAGVACDSTGNVYVVAEQTSGDISFSDGYDAGGDDASYNSFVARLAPDGGTTWARALSNGMLTGIAVDRCADQVVAIGTSFGRPYGPFALESADGGTFSSDAAASVIARLAR